MRSHALTEIDRFFRKTGRIVVALAVKGARKGVRKNCAMRHSP